MVIPFAKCKNHRVPRIVLTDDTSTPIGSAFLDDSFRRDDVYSPVVVARIPAGADLRWHGEVVTRLARKSRELKASRVLARATRS
jgi:hypothetical protein